MHEFVRNIAAKSIDKWCFPTWLFFAEKNKWRATDKQAESHTDRYFSKPDQYASKLDVFISVNSTTLPVTQAAYVGNPVEGIVEVILSSVFWAVEFVIQIQFVSSYMIIMSDMTHAS